MKLATNTGLDLTGILGGERMARLTIKVLLYRQKNTFSYIVMQVIWCLKFCDITKSGGGTISRSKFWGTSPPVIYAHGYKQSTRKRKLLTKFTRSEVKGQGHSETKST